VVADEVRKLAEQTTKATKEIAGMVQAIQSGTTHAVEAMKLSSGEVETGVEKTSATGTVLTEIVQTIEQVGEMISHIATAATEQSATTDHINESLTRIADLRHEASSGAKETAKACADLSKLAAELLEMVSRFKYGAEDQTSQRPAGRPLVRAAGAH